MLAVEGLCKSFGGFLAVSRVSFEVHEGEILGLIGPNGSGKSTTFNLIAGNLRPSSGSIRFAGQEIGGMSAHHDFAGTRIERYYHFICRPDQQLFDVLAEFGLTERLRWRATEMGFFYEGKLYDWGRPDCLLRFPHLTTASTP